MEPAALAAMAERWRRQSPYDLERDCAAQTLSFDHDPSCPVLFSARPVEHSKENHARLCATSPRPAERAVARPRRPSPQEARSWPRPDPARPVTAQQKPVSGPENRTFTL